MIRSDARRTSKRHFVPAMVLCALLSIGALQTSGADTEFVIGHAPQGLAAAGRNLALSAMVMSTCTIAQCGDISLVAVYRVPGGTRFTSVSLPARSAQLGRITLPGIDVRVPSLTYRLETYQQRCFFMSCPTASGKTQWYTVMVREM